MNLVAASDKTAQRALVIRLMPRVRRVSEVILRNTADAEDATQLGLLEILRSAGGYRGDASLERWADRVTARTAMRLVRERRRDTQSVDAETDPDELVAPPDPALDERDEARPVEAYLAELNPKLREVLVLRHTMDHSIDEIATLVGASPNTVKDRLLRAREQLRKLVRRGRAIGHHAASEDP
jgi:RNA polymerase sigma-70 factor (ECF subfamily)